MRILAALAFFIASFCTWTVSAAYLAASGFSGAAALAAFLSHSAHLHSVAQFSATLFAWSLVVFLTAVAQLIGSLGLLRARNRWFAAFAAVAAFAVCLFDLHLPLAAFNGIEWLDSASLAGSFLAFPATLAPRTV